MFRRFLPSALLLGNFVVGVSVLAPAGMLGELARGFEVSVREAALLITFGAVVMCVGSPLLAWSTSRMDRRVLLGTSLSIIAACSLGSAFATSYVALLILRLLMLAAAAPFTPQAASVVGVLASPERQASTVAFIFLGWSLATAAGVPLVVTSLASHYGFRAPYLAIGVIAALSCAFLVWRLPAGVKTAPVQLATWAELARNGEVVRLLSLTVLLTTGQFVVLTFFGPLLAGLAHAGPAMTGLMFALFGVSGLIGNVAATHMVRSRGPYQTSLVAVGAMALGVVIWALAPGALPLMVVAVGVWGLGFASSNSMQQARLIAAAPPVAAASVALNTSSIYIGQAIGSALGGLLFASEHPLAMGYCAALFTLAGLALLISTRPREANAGAEHAAASAT